MISVDVPPRFQEIVVDEFNGGYQTWPMIVSFSRLRDGFIKLADSNPAFLDWLYGHISGYIYDIINNEPSLTFYRTEIDSGWIKELRKKMNLNQEKFAQKIGVSLSTVRRWESGEMLPRGVARSKVENLMNKYF